jgi:hypothetical protein
VRIAVNLVVDIPENGLEQFQQTEGIPHDQIGHLVRELIWEECRQARWLTTCHGRVELAPEDER